VPAVGTQLNTAPDWPDPPRGVGAAGAAVTETSTHTKIPYLHQTPATPPYPMRSGTHLFKKNFALYDLD